MHVFDPPFIRLSVIESIEHLAPNRAKDFLLAYKLASGEIALLGREPATNKLWTETRRNFINRHEQQAKKLREAFWTPSGVPSPRHLAMMMWAYTPTPERTSKWIAGLSSGHADRVHPAPRRSVPRSFGSEPPVPQEREARRRGGSRASARTGRRTDRG